MKAKKLDFLTDRELGWLMLRTLHKGYDFERSDNSPRKKLLKAWFAAEKDAHFRPAAVWTADMLVAEAKKRTARMRFAESLDPFPLEVRGLKQRQLGYCVLRTLIEWYREERRQTRSETYRMMLLREVELIELALHMVYVISFARGPICTFDPDAMIRESEYRSAVRKKRDTKRQD